MKNFIACLFAFTAIYCNAQVPIRTFNNQQEKVEVKQNSNYAENNEFEYDSSAVYLSVKNLKKKGFYDGKKILFLPTTGELDEKCVFQYYDGFTTTQTVVKKKKVYESQSVYKGVTVNDAPVRLSEMRTMNIENLSGVFTPKEFVEGCVFTIQSVEYDDSVSSTFPTITFHLIDKDSVDVTYRTAQLVISPTKEEFAPILLIEGFNKLKQKYEGKYFAPYQKGYDDEKEVRKYAARDISTKQYFSVEEPFRCDEVCLSNVNGWVQQMKRMPEYAPNRVSYYTPTIIIFTSKGESLIVEVTPNDEPMKKTIFIPSSSLNKFHILTNHRIISKEQFDSILLARKQLEEEKERKKAEFEIKRAAELERQKKADEDYKKQLVKKYGSKYGQLIYENKIAIGMTKEMCRESWGLPKDINTMVSAYSGTTEQWIYGEFPKCKYVYFDNGILTTIQD